MKENNRDYFELKIREALEEFKQGYKARDTKVVDQFIDKLFDKNDKTAVLGTSFGEWMMGLAGAKEIVESDWQYWGDVDINTEDVDITTFDGTAFVNVKGTVRYEFEYTDEKFDGYLKFVKHFFDSSDQDYKMSAKVKAGQIGFVLTHFNQIRKEGKREYFYPLRINAVMMMQGDRAVFRFMKFSMDSYSQYPELRIDNQMMDMNEYYEQQQSFVEVCKKENRPEAKEILDSFMKFIKEGFNRDTKEIDEISQYFSSSKCNYVIDIKGNINKDKAAWKTLQNLKHTWQKLAVDEKAVYSDVSGTTAWIVCNGLASRTINEQEGAEALMANIQKLVDMDIESKEKLFSVQKQVADYFLQYAKGEYFLWPIRIAAMFIKENGQWKLYGMSFSYPFYYILEGKYDAAIEIE